MMQPPPERMAEMFRQLAIAHWDRGISPHDLVALLTYAEMGRTLAWLNSHRAHATTPAEPQAEPTTNPTQ